MKIPIKTVLIFLIALVLAACKAECPPERISYSDDLSSFPPKAVIEELTQTKMEIKGEQVLIDRVITGPVCNDTWSGVIYVTCDIQIPVWERDAFFFQDCDLEIEPGTQVYVEAHKDKLYTEGCSCHE